MRQLHITSQNGIVKKRTTNGRRIFPGFLPGIYVFEYIWIT
jgi:hypothetical protein